MRKTVSITGYVLGPHNEFVDYGFGDIFMTPENAMKQGLVTTYIEDNSLCPPLYEDAVSFEKDKDYKATVIGVNDSQSWVRISIDGVTSTDPCIVYFDHLLKYWGAPSCVHENYKEGDEITVRFSVTKSSGEGKPGLQSFTEKGVRILPFSSFTYKVGDIIRVHVGPIAGKKSLVWFNGKTSEILPTYDALFQRRVRNHIYYPGREVKAQVVRVDDSSKSWTRFFKFSVIHERVDYGLQIGEYPCVIYEEYVYGGSVKRIALIDAVINDVKTRYSFEITSDEYPSAFPSHPQIKYHSVIRITGFDEIGEPIIQFKSLMDELYAAHEGETFDITLVKPNVQGAKYRIWMGSNGLCGTVSKNVLSSLGDYVAGLYGRLENGKLLVSKRGETISQIKVGDTISDAVIVSRHSTCCSISVRDRQGWLCNVSDVNDSDASLEVRVVFVDETKNLILCVPSNSATISISGVEIDSIVSLRILSILPGHIILGDGLHLGVMRRSYWDWTNGLSLKQYSESSLYFDVKVKGIIDSGILVLDRRSLIDNPWDKLSVSEGQSIDVRVENIASDAVIVSYGSVFTSVKWNNFCPYDFSYGQYIYDVGQTVTLKIKALNTESHILLLSCLPEKALSDSNYFDKSLDYEASVIKLIPTGVLIKVKDIYGVIPARYMLHESVYDKNPYVSVRFVKHAYNGNLNYFEFSHIATIEVSSLIKYGSIIHSAVFEKVLDQWLTFSYEGILISCHKSCVKYFSEDRDYKFVEKMIPGQTYDLRIVDVNNIRAVPNAMPDYSSIPVGKQFEGHILKIYDNGYLVNIDELNDSFVLPFVDYCDWSSVHYETRQIGDKVMLTVVAYYSELNRPYFSLIAGQKDPWAELKAGDTIVVNGLGSILKKQDFYVSVRGVPVLLSINAICALIGKPWIKEALSYESFKLLEGDNEFEMDILSIDIMTHHMELVPHHSTCPRIVHNAKVAHLQKNGVWVRCGGNLVGYLPNEEIPEGYAYTNTIEQALCKGYVSGQGYVLLSVKELFADSDPGQDNEKDNGDKELNGIVVTHETELREKQVVRGVLKNLDNKHYRYFIAVGPYTGIINFNELSHINCDAAKYVIEKDKEYDFYITKIFENPKGKLLYLSWKPLLPLPSNEIEIGEKVHAKVLRYDSTEEIIVAGLDEYNNIEAIIYPSDLEGCKIGKKVSYPPIGFKFSAEIKNIERDRARGYIRRIRLAKGIGIK